MFSSTERFNAKLTFFPPYFDTQIQHRFFVSRGNENPNIKVTQRHSSFLKAPYWTHFSVTKSQAFILAITLFFYWKSYKIQIRTSVHIQSLIITIFIPVAFTILSVLINLAWKTFSCLWCRFCLFCVKNFKKIHRL